MSVKMQIVLGRTTRKIVVTGFLAILALSSSGQVMEHHAHSDAHEKKLLQHSVIRAVTCTGPTSSNPRSYWLEEQDHTGAARGRAPFLPNADTYPVYRNVKTYNAKGDGNTDDTQSLQDAINDDGKGGNRYQNEVSTRPAQIFVPGGTYKLTNQLDLRLNTILVGDPNDMPIFDASPNFKGDTVINGYDYATHDSGGTTNFLVTMKNVVIDTTSIDRNKNIVALQWGVAQGCQLSNIRINMPTYSRGHVGIAMDQGSAIAVSDIVGPLYPPKK